MLDTHELGHRAGTQRQASRRIPAPADLGIDMLGVPEGSDIDLALRLEAVMEGVLVTGTASVHLSGECVRCLDTVEDDLVVDLQELYAYDDDPDAPEDDETSRLEGDLLDLEPVLRDAVVLALPHNPLCGPDCPGLCPECGARLADDPEHTHGEVLDPRWAALSQLSNNDQSTAGPIPGPNEE
ncbi:MAG: YceD family protein [Nocardioidaceae bacterium]